MSYYIKLDNDKKIELPNDLDIGERIKLCEKIIDEYPQYFTQCLAGSGCSETASRKVEFRLEVMANYLLSYTKSDNNYPLISDYKSKLIKNNEKSFTDFEHNYDF